MVLGMLIDLIFLDLCPKDERDPARPTMDLGFFEGAGRVLSLLRAGETVTRRHPVLALQCRHPGASIEGAPDHAFG
jgi:hypothetical protein